MVPGRRSHNPQAVVAGRYLADAASAAIVGALEILADDPTLPTNLKPFLTTANRQAARITSLSDSLLDVERVGQGKLRLDTDSVDLAALAAYVAELTGGDIQVDVETGLRVIADPARLEQMLVNLTTKAPRHGAPPVVIEARGVGDTVSVTVATASHYATSRTCSSASAPPTGTTGRSDWDCGS